MYTNPTSTPRQSLTPLFSILENLSFIINRVIFPWNELELDIGTSFPTPVSNFSTNSDYDNGSDINYGSDSHSHNHSHGHSTGISNKIIIKKRTMVHRNQNRRRVGASWDVDTRSRRRISICGFEGSKDFDTVTSEKEDVDGLDKGNMEDLEDLDIEGLDTEDLKMVEKDAWIDEVVMQAAKWGGERVSNRVLEGVVDEVQNRVMVKEVGVGRDGWVVVEYV
ncbi:hypothetical protein BZA77DRAFT_58215 [Pyronema omphalodes]|nr:hypothetical protein BZA77DRAFT_58215 [Pyronema omphalodes]